MTLRHLNPFALLAPALAFLTVALVLGAMNGAPEPSVERSVQPHVSEARAYTARGNAYIQRARETGDPGGTLIAGAERAFDAALRRSPGDSDALTGKGLVALNGHDFRAGLDLGLRARRAGPDLVRPYAVLVDAQIELGRYEAAGRSLQRMIDLRPNLASYSRASYYRELHGDHAGALRAMALAVSAGGDAPEQVAYVQTLLGDLHLGHGELPAATDAYRLALSRLPGYVDARFGLARTQVQAGALEPARRSLLAVVRDRPDADHLVLLGEVELALGRAGDGRRHIAAARAKEAALLRGGANPDAGLVNIEATHGDPAQAVRLGRKVWSAAPSVTSADALGWALTRSGRPELGLAFARKAMRIGSRYAGFEYHAGVAALATGRKALAREHLARALRINPAFSPLQAPRARRLLSRLSGTPAGRG